MGSPTPSLQHACAHCGLNAKSFCKGCKDAPDINSEALITVWYCSARCQKQDWSKHRGSCKEAQSRRASNPTEAIKQQPLQHLCAHCSGEASLNCKACKGAPHSVDLKNPVTVWYCGGDCQKKDWVNHKPFCKGAQARLMLVRAAAILQETWYIFNRTTNMFTVERIQKLGGEWLLHPPKKIPGNSQLVPFPPACITTEVEEKALLSFEKCHTAITFLYSFLNFLLQGICSEISEVDCHVENPPFRLRRGFTNGIFDWTNYKHAILKVTLKNDAQYALDITGAQYGWSEAVLPWNTYANSRIQRIVETLKFGHAQGELSKRTAQNGGKMPWIDGIFNSFAQAFDVAVVNFHKSGMTSNELLVLPEADHKTGRALLLNHIRHLLEDFKEYAEKQEMFKVNYPDSDDLTFQNRFQGKQYTLSTDILKT